jgi:hypothetical protein
MIGHLSPSQRADVSLSHSQGPEGFLYDELCGLEAEAACSVYPWSRANTCEKTCDLIDRQVYLHFRLRWEDTCELKVDRSLAAESFSSSSSSIPVAPTWSIGQSVGFPRPGISPSQGRYLTQAHNKHRHTEPLLCNDLEISKYTRTVSRQRLGEHVPAATETHVTIEILLETAFSTQSLQRSYKEDNWGPCGGGVEYLHRDPASRRRRRNI